MSNGKFPVLKALVVGVILLMVLTTTVLQIVEKVRTGHGLDYYLNGMGVEMNYIGALIAVAIIPIALLLGWAIRWWLLKDERDFKKHHGIKD